MGVFSRSWKIAKVSFKMIKEEKELLVFPILSAIFSIIFLILMILPYLMSFIASEFTSAPGLDVLFYVIAFVLYFGFAFIATFFNVCVVYTAAIKFSKGDPKFGSTIKYAFSKIHLIFLWSIVSATVGLLFMILENIANKMKGAGKIILLVVRGLLGVAWSLITIFVIPAMVYHNLGPFKAIKKSAGVFKKTWGEYFVKSFGMGIIAFLFIILGSLMFIALIIVSFYFRNWFNGINIYSFMDFLHNNNNCSYFWGC